MLIKRASGRSAFGLVEFLISMVLGAIVVGATLTLFSASNKQMARMLNYCDLNVKSQMAIDSLTRDIRNANRVMAYTSYSLQLEDADGLPITYALDTARGELNRTKNGVSKVLLRGCESLTFTLGKRNPAGTFGSFPASSPAECKVINVSWKCYRTLLGRKETTENMTTANIVLRRQGT